MKDLPNSSQFKIDKKIHERIQKAARKKESSLPVTNCKNKVLSGNVFLFNKELHENFEKIQPLEISNVRIEKKEKSSQQ